MQLFATLQLTPHCVVPLRPAHLTPTADAATPLLLNPSAYAQGIAQERGQMERRRRNFSPLPDMGPHVASLLAWGKQTPLLRCPLTGVPDNGTCLLFPLAIYWRGG